MDNTRRNFIKGAGAIAASMMMPMTFGMRNAHAVTGGKKLVVLNLHGGNDGLNLAVPMGVGPTSSADQYALYQGYRPNIHIPLADLLPVGADMGGQQFGLHPAMASLQPYFSNLAVFPATHSSVGTNANRSHFYQMDLYGAGMEDNNPVAQDGKGWIGRYFDSKYPSGSAPSGIIGQDFTSGTHGETKGETFLLQMSNPENISLGANATLTNEIWNEVKALTGVQPGTYGGDFHDKQIRLFDEVLSRLETDVNFDRVPAVAYPSGRLGDAFERAGNMLMDLPELEVIQIAHDGYDTHRDQITNDPVTGTYDPLTGRQANLLKQWADAIAALYANLDAIDPQLRSNVIVTVQTEFGRTVKENANFGTDHGNASCWMAFGDSVTGGVYGSYPGLETENLNGGNWLKPTIDYRDIFSEILGQSHLGLANGGDAFPNYSVPSSPIGFIA